MEKFIPDKVRTSAAQHQSIGLVKLIIGPQHQCGEDSAEKLACGFSLVTTLLSKPVYLGSTVKASKSLYRQGEEL